MKTSLASQKILHCSCGYDINHKQVEKLEIYNWWQWSFLIFGISVKAAGFRYQCAVCLFEFQKIKNT